MLILSPPKREDFAAYCFAAHSGNIVCDSTFVIEVCGMSPHWKRDTSLGRHLQLIQITQCREENKIHKQFDRYIDGNIKYLQKRMSTDA